MGTYGRDSDKAKPEVEIKNRRIIETKEGKQSNCCGSGSFRICSTPTLNDGYE